MSARVLNVSFTEAKNFADFIDHQLLHGRALVACEEHVELFEEITLRVKFAGQAHDFPAVVAQPRVPQVNQRWAVGLQLCVDARLRDRLLTLRFRATPKKAAAVTKRIQPVDDKAILRRRAAPKPRPKPRPEPRSEAPPEARTEAPPKNETTPHTAATYWRADGTPRGGVACGNDAARASAAEEPDAFDDREPTQRRLTISTSGPVVRLPASERLEARSAERLNETPWSVERLRKVVQRHRDQVDARAEEVNVTPERALRANDYFEAAKADLEANRVDMARTNLNLAIAYNANEPAYRALLLNLERRLAQAR